MRSCLGPPRCALIDDLDDRLAFLRVAAARLSTRGTSGFFCWKLRLLHCEAYRKKPSMQPCIAPGPVRALSIQTYPSMLSASVCAQRERDRERGSHLAQVLHLCLEACSSLHRGETEVDLGLAMEKSLSVSLQRCLSQYSRRHTA